MSFLNPFLVQSGDFSNFILNFVPPPKVPIRILYVTMSIIVKSGMKITIMVIVEFVQMLQEWLIRIDKCVSY